MPTSMPKNMLLGPVPPTPRPTVGFSRRVLRGHCSVIGPTSAPAPATPPPFPPPSPPTCSALCGIKVLPTPCAFYSIILPTSDLFRPRGPARSWSPTCSTLGGRYCFMRPQVRRSMNRPHSSSSAAERSAPRATSASEASASWWHAWFHLWVSSCELTRGCGMGARQANKPVISTRRPTAGRPWEYVQGRVSVRSANNRNAWMRKWATVSPWRR